MGRSWEDMDSIFQNNITPLNALNLNKLKNNLLYLLENVESLIPLIGGSSTPLPQQSGDGIIRYVLTVAHDMIYRCNAARNGIEGNLPAGMQANQRYFVAVCDNWDTYTYHLEIWCAESSSTWKKSNKWNVTDPDSGITYTTQCWDRCTHDKMYVCQNTNKCYYMNSIYGIGIVGHKIDNGKTDDAPIFMTETAQAASVVFKGDRKGWETYNGEMNCGIPIEWLYRFKMIVMSFDIVDGANWPVGQSTHQLINVAFDPWWYHGNELFVPICNIYDFNYGDADKAITYGVLEVNNRNDESGGTDKRFRFKVWLPSSQGGSKGVTYKSIYIRAIVGVADISLDWDHAAHN